MNEHLKKAFAPAQLGGLQLRNRIIKAATFEGKTPGGIPGQSFLDFHREICEGGIGMTTLAYCTTEPNGRLHNNVMHMHEELVPRLREITRNLKKTGARVSGQMTHCGYFTKNRRQQGRIFPRGPSLQLNLYGLPHGVPLGLAMRKSDIDRLVQSYHDAALQMKEAGFDAIEIHFGHGYCLSQFISPKTNRRSDEYGGSLHNRMRLPLRALEAVRKAVGSELPILAKMGLSDGVRGGLKTDEAVEVAALLEKGGADALICSGGTSSFNTMLTFRGESVAHGMIEQETNPIAKFGMKLLAGKMFREYPYEELYFLERARRVRERVQCAVVYIGGCSNTQSLETVMREGFDFVQLGRALIKDPAFVQHAQADPQGYENGCTHCNRCVALIEHPQGIRCVLN